MSGKVSKGLRRLALQNCHQWQHLKRYPTVNPKRRWLRRAKRLWNALPWLERSKVHLPV